MAGSAISGVGAPCPATAVLVIASRFKGRAACGTKTVNVVKLACHVCERNSCQHSMALTEVAGGRETSM
jgi:hypothetical protein